MKRARWAFILMAWSLSIFAGFFAGKTGWLSFVDYLLTFSSGVLIASAWGFNFPKALSDRWPHLYPPEKS